MIWIGRSNSFPGSVRSTHYISFVRFQFVSLETTYFQLKLSMWVIFYLFTSIKYATH